MCTKLTLEVIQGTFIFCRIENLESLTGLQVLNLTGNNISQIPNWLPKKLKTLQVFKISKNNVDSVGD